MKLRDKWLVPAFCGLLCVYVGVYAVLSLEGHYEPAAWGLDHVKAYAWAPRGFVKDFQWSRPLMLIFSPLYYLDTHYWHKEKDSHSGKYPINEVD